MIWIPISSSDNDLCQNQCCNGIPRPQRRFFLIPSFLHPYTIRATEPAIHNNCHNMILRSNPMLYPSPKDCECCIEYPKVFFILRQIGFIRLFYLSSLNFLHPARHLLIQIRNAKQQYAKAEIGNDLAARCKQSHIIEHHFPGGK